MPSLASRARGPGLTRYMRIRRPLVPPRFPTRPSNRAPPNCAQVADLIEETTPTQYHTHGGGRPANAGQWSGTTRAVWREYAYRLAVGTHAEPCPHPTSPTGASETTASARQTGCHDEHPMHGAVQAGGGIGVGSFRDSTLHSRSGGDGAAGSSLVSLSNSCCTRYQRYSMSMPASFSLFFKCI